MVFYTQDGHRYVDEKKGQGTFASKDIIKLTFSLSSDECTLQKYCVFTVRMAQQLNNKKSEGVKRPTLGYTKRMSSTYDVRFVPRWVGSILGPGIRAQAFMV